MKQELTVALLGIRRQHLVLATEHEIAREHYGADALETTRIERAANDLLKIADELADFLRRHGGT